MLPGDFKNLFVFILFKHPALSLSYAQSKLPKGIQKMRSHLSEVDDVPLLVPLFTECSSSGESVSQ